MHTPLIEPSLGTTAATYVPYIISVLVLIFSSFLGHSHINGKYSPPKYWHCRNLHCYTCTVSSAHPPPPPPHLLDLTIWILVSSLSDVLSSLCKLMGLLVGIWNQMRKEWIWFDSQQLFVGKSVRWRHKEDKKRLLTEFWKCMYFLYQRKRNRLLFKKNFNLNIWWLTSHPMLEAFSWYLLKWVWKGLSMLLFLLLLLVLVVLLVRKPEFK